LQPSGITPLYLLTLNRAAQQHAVAAFVCEKSVMVVPFAGNDCSIETKKTVYYNDENLTSLLS
jgi:hypothetical protein